METGAYSIILSQGFFFQQVVDHRKEQVGHHVVPGSRAIVGFELEIIGLKFLDCGFITFRIMAEQVGLGFTDFFETGNFDFPGKN